MRRAIRAALIVIGLRRCADLLSWPASMRLAISISPRVAVHAAHLRGTATGSSVRRAPRPRRSPRRPPRGLRGSRGWGPSPPALGFDDVDPGSDTWHRVLDCWRTTSWAAGGVQLVVGDIARFLAFWTSFLSSAPGIEEGASGPSSRASSLRVGLRLRFWSHFFSWHCNKRFYRPFWPFLGC